MTDNVVPLTVEYHPDPDNDGSLLDITAAAAKVVEASRAVGTVHPTMHRQAKHDRDLLLSLWAALIGHPGDVTLALQHAYMVTLHGSPLTSRIDLDGQS